MENEDTEEMEKAEEASMHFMNHSTQTIFSTPMSEVNGAEPYH
jgi:hypothetical protein